MDDKDRMLVEHVLQAAGTAGQQGFAAMVRYQWTEGLTTVIGCTLAIAVFMAMIYVMFRITAKWREDDRDPCRLIVSGIATVIMIIIMSTGLMDGVTKMIAPEGAAISHALHHS